MRILLLARSFNSLTQRLWVELARRGHELSLEYDIADSVTEEAVDLFAPDLIIAPFMKRAIPEAVWRRVTCLVVHPGIAGDRGPSALDWAIENGEREWGVTVLQAVAEMDAGDIWATATFPMREARKASLYRNEVTEAATRAVLEAVERCAAGGWRPRPLDYADPEVRGRARPLMRQDDRRIDWSRDSTAAVLRKMCAADTTPGVLDGLFGTACYLYDAHAEDRLRGARPGEVFARRDGAVLRATVDGAVWIGHARRTEPEALKLPVALAFPADVSPLPEAPLTWDAPDDHATFREIRYEEEGAVGYLHFPFYNGAMSTAQCGRLLATYRAALARPTRVLVLMGGPDYWSNGIHLNVIEAAASPADESWRNINAIDDLAQAVIETTDRMTVAALQGSAGAGGAFLALAADRVWARDGVLLNPHYKNMGNLYGSEYWSYLLPRRTGPDAARTVMSHRLPVSAQEARAQGLVDEVLAADPLAFVREVRARAQALAGAEDHGARVAAKRESRTRDEAARPLAAYRDEELAQMRRNFYGFDPSYHVARFHFVQKTPPSWTPRHLARHRDIAPRRLPAAA